MINWGNEYWKLRIKLIRASLWQLFLFWLTRNEERLYGLANREFLELFKDELLLRRLLWEHHGCSGEYLYGDDGELQCSNPKHRPNPFDSADFRRDSAQLLEWKLGNEMCHKLLPRPEK
ncbi:hypothetical protein LCGC14_2330960 [marine sediment metagenome]|uniref:Uncharacterized protein n=1 Tax=marine sediment metagenome TaxID=412755 RepID=A0A0F9D2C2_9ZZZZ